MRPGDKPMIRIEHGELSDDSTKHDNVHKEGTIKD